MIFHNTVFWKEDPNLVTFSHWNKSLKSSQASANRLKPNVSFHLLNPKWYQPLDFMRGFLMHDKKRTSLGLPARYSKGNVLGVLLNLDKMLGPEDVMFGYGSRIKRTFSSQTLWGSLRSDQGFVGILRELDPPNHQISLMDSNRQILQYQLQDFQELT